MKRPTIRYTEKLIAQLGVYFDTLGHAVYWDINSDRKNRTRTYLKERLIY